MKLGTTFSHRHLISLGLEPQSAFRSLLDLKFDLIRLCGYLDELWPSSDNFYFKQLDWYLEQCEASGQSCLLTLGMKAPRWPEFYLPGWLTKRNLVHYLPEYICQAIQYFGKYSCIHYWQIENEPLDPSGPNKQQVDFEVLQAEVAAARQTGTDLPIILTAWGNELKQRNIAIKMASLADIIGIDMYYRVPAFWKFYTGPAASDNYYRDLPGKLNKPVWLAELQAEPWEKTVIPPIHHTPSMNPSRLKTNLAQATLLQYPVVLLWGFEYWYWLRQQGYPEYWKTVTEIIRNRD